MNINETFGLIRFDSIGRHRNKRISHAVDGCVHNVLYATIASLDRLVVQQKEILFSLIVDWPFF